MQSFIIYVNDQIKQIKELRTFKGAGPVFTILGMDRVQKHWFKLSNCVEQFVRPLFKGIKNKGRDIGSVLYIIMYF